jgi:hypothetical protein
MRYAPPRGASVLVMASARRDAVPATAATARRRPALPALPSLPRLVARLRAGWALRAASRARGAGGDVRRALRVFRLNGLRWHHLAIARDLARFRAYVDGVDCGKLGAEGLAELAGIFSFFVDRNWGVYNRLERDVLFPWVVEGGRGSKGEADVVRAVDAFGGERDRIEEDARVLRARLDRMARKGRLRASVLENRRGVCDHEMRKVSAEVGMLLEDATRLHAAEEEVLFPYIARQFTREQQRSLTFRIIDMLDKPLAKFTIVSLHEGLKTAAATRADWRAYEREVPAPVRYYLWVWRGRLWEPSPLAKLDPAVTNTPESDKRAMGGGAVLADEATAKADMTARLQAQREKAAAGGVADTGNLR